MALLKHFRNNCLSELLNKSSQFTALSVNIYSKFKYIFGARQEIYKLLWTPWDVCGRFEILIFQKVSFNFLQITFSFIDFRCKLIMLIMLRQLLHISIISWHCQFNLYRDRFNQFSIYRTSDTYTISWCMFWVYVSKQQFNLFEHARLNLRA